jgi:hypothetical protein
MTVTSNASILVQAVTSAVTPIVTSTIASTSTAAKQSSAARSSEILNSRASLTSTPSVLWDESSANLSTEPQTTVDVSALLSSQGMSVSEVTLKMTDHVTSTSNWSPTVQSVSQSSDLTGKNTVLTVNHSSSDDRAVSDTSRIPQSTRVTTTTPSPNAPSPTPALLEGINTASWHL